MVNVYEITHEGLTFVVEEDGGGFVACIPALPRCHTQGDDLDEAVANIKEAFELYMDSALELGLEVPDRYRTLRLQRAS